MGVVRETKLPGVGVRHEFTSERGENIGVLVHHDGRRDVLVYSADDPDACSATIELSRADTRTMSELLGSMMRPRARSGPRTIRIGRTLLFVLAAAVSGLAASPTTPPVPAPPSPTASIGNARVPPSSPYSETGSRSRPPNRTSC